MTYSETSGTSMALLNVELQTANDNKFAAELAKQSEGMDEINTRARFIAELTRKLVTERNKDQDTTDLSEHEEVIREYQEKHYPNTGYIDPFYGMNLQKVELRDLDRTIADLQEVTRRDVTEIQNMGREYEREAQIYNTLLSTASQDPNRENRQAIKNQRT